MHTTIDALRSRWGIPVAALVAFLLTQYWDVLWIPFINEDYAFVDMSGRHSAVALLRDPGLYAGPWFRPLSQGLHYWLLQRVFGLEILGWHAVSMALGLAIWIGYFALVRRIAGAEVASIATASVAALAGWGPLIAWIAGVQDLWMLLFVMLSLHAVARNRFFWAALCLGLALASKETAIVFPLVAVAWLVLLERRPPRAAVTSTWPLWVVALGWLLMHPTIGASHWASSQTERGSHRMISLKAAHKLLPALLNLDQPIHPEAGWIRPLTEALLGAIPLLALVLWARHRGKGAVSEQPRPTTQDDNGPPHRNLIIFGICWASLGWMPLLLPSLDWHGYYALFGMLGVWIALSVALRRAPRLVVTALIIGLCVSRSGRAVTTARDWGEESYVRRAGEFLTSMRLDLLEKVPKPALHTRFYFGAVPTGVGFLIGDGPALRVWYRDSTLSGGFWRDFRTRKPGEPSGADRFFRYDRTAGWIEIVLGAENVTAAQELDPLWATDHDLVAVALALGGDHFRAEVEYAKLAVAFPDSADYPYLASLMAVDRGDSAAAQGWRARAIAIQSRAQ